MPSAGGRSGSAGELAMPDPQKNAVVRAAIHPSIGVARLGNSRDEYFLAPEIVDPPPEPPGFYRDPTGALKRQAVRFRIYGLNAEGQVVTELTQSNAEITWTVHLANKKAAWYQFQIALDIPEAQSAPHAFLRNVAIPDRKNLVIDPGARQITGVNSGGGTAYSFDTGKFMGTPVYLGELRTDEQGRLIVLGGRGKSASYTNTPALTFANNEGWYDDTADGPVTATVQFQGKPLKVDPAWVVVAPPNYAPAQKSVRTMWDLMQDTAIKAKMAPFPLFPSFNTDIRPIFERLSRLQWVNAGYAAAFGWKGPNNYATADWLTRLSSNSPDEVEMRRTIANQFRNFSRDAWSPTPWPWQYGDAMNIPPVHSPRQNVALSDIQLSLLQDWAEGNFDADYDPTAAPLQSLADVPLAAQADMLDRASLEFCLADAFHPGCEMTWPMRHASLYMAPFRIAHAPDDWIEPDYGVVMNPGEMLGLLPFGPLGPQVPGGITRWMALPWQTDTASCRSGYIKSYDPYLPTFWPARVPNQVLTEASYDIVMDTQQPLEARLKAFAQRVAWVRPLGAKGYTSQLNNMIANFGDMGVVEPRPGPGDPHFPPSLDVENLPKHTIERLALEPDSAYAADEIDLTGIEKVRRFSHGLEH
jgi:L-Lysine epsilon oxidase N-terminal/L-lysine epsilon oxidase C-terminal domain